MFDERQDVLDYIRLLYERQASASAKAGMTLWAVLAGLVYLFWNTFDILLVIQDLGVFKESFYYYFGNVYVFVLSVSMLVSYSGVLRDKRDYDYRIYKKDPSGLGFLIVIFAFLFVWFYFSDQASVLENNRLYAFQREVNYYFSCVAIALLSISFVVNFFKKSKRDMPPPSSFSFLESTKFQIIYYGFVLLIILELLFGNLSVIAVGFYSASYDPVAIIVSFNISLVFLAVIFVLRIKSEKDRLVFLSRLE